MSNKIDWSKAPEGATHYTPKGTGVYAAFWRKHCGEWKDAWVIEGQDGAIVHYKGPSSPSFESLAVERPATPSWSGEGLPPVGVVCEYCCVNGQWRQVKVIAHMIEMQKDNPCAVSQLGDTGPLCIGGASSFRPIRAPEQIAADERDTAVDEMHKLYMEGAKHSGGLYALYDAGYRKP